MKDGTPLGAAVAMLVWRPANLFLNLAGLMVMSRLLDPVAFGIFAPLGPAFWTALMAVEFGAQSNLLRGRGPFDRAGLTSAAGLWTALAIGITCIFLVVALVLGGPYAAPLIVLAIGIPLAVPTLIAETQLRYDLRTQMLARSHAAGVAVGLVVGALSALAGHGAAALAAAMVAERAAYLGIIAWRGAIGGIRPQRGGWWPHLRFGVAYTPTELLPQGSIALRLSFVSAVLGAPALGLFNRAETVAKINDRLTLEAMEPITLPIMSSLYRAGRPVGEIYLGKIALLSSVCWPAAAVIAIMADPLVSLLLGAQWTETVILVQILAGLGLSAPFTKMAIKSFALVGAERVALRLQASQQVIAILLVSGAAFVSIEAVCGATVLAMAIKGWRLSSALERLTGVSRTEMIRVLGGAVVLSVAAGLGPAALMIWAASDLGIIATLASAVVLAAVGWLAALVALDHPLYGHLREAAVGAFSPSA